jgi:hypothetical protein
MCSEKGVEVTVVELWFVPSVDNCTMYEGNSVSRLQIQVSTYVFELSAGNCHR